MCYSHTHQCHLEREMPLWIDRSLVRLFVRSSVVLVGGSLTNIQERKTHLAFFFPIMYAPKSPVRTVCVIVMSTYKEEKKSRLIDRKTISVFLRLWFEQQHNIGISNFSRPLSIHKSRLDISSIRKKEREREIEREGHDNLSKGIAWIIDKCTIGKLH